MPFPMTSSHLYLVEMLLSVLQPELQASSSSNKLPGLYRLEQDKEPNTELFNT